MTEQQVSLSRVSAVLTGKGGVGKTSLVANISGQLARAGYRVLAVDLDLSGNLGLDLGYAGAEGDDDGVGLVNAVWRNQELPVIRSIRERLDVIPGGRQLEVLSALALSPLSEDLEGGGVPGEFARKLAEIAGDYDLVLLDGPPGNPVLQDLALYSARYLLIPTKTDAGGWDGLRLLGPRVKKARAANPNLAYLGAVLFGHGTSANRVLTSTQQRLEVVGETVPLFEAYIRHSETTAHDCRNRGQLAHELSKDAESARHERLALLRAHRGKGRHRATGTKARRLDMPAMPASLSGSAADVAADYERVTREMLMRISAHEQTTPINAVTGR